ncbi:MAG TPA: hypothetical protein VF092_02250 [Longimicrobium sp.]
MNVGLNSLRARIPSLPESPDDVAKLLEERGFRVTRAVPLSEMLRPVVVARVESVTQHPNADRLKVCSVDDGTEQRLQIVTGADNVQAGASYPLIRGGVTLPDGRKIKRGKLRGEVSEGMLGSADELELGTDHEGLYTLPDGFAPGTPLTDVIPTPGVVFVLEGNGEIDDVVAKLTGSAEQSESS